MKYALRTVYPISKARHTVAGLLCFLSAAVMGSAYAAGPKGGCLCARGIIRPVHQASIATELVAVVSKIAFEEGDRFKAGDLLIAFDCRKHRAEHASLLAQHREMKSALESNQYLERHKAIGKHDLEISQARVDKAAAEAEALRVRLDLCEIRAPFNGRIAELTINQFEIPSTGRPFLTIIEDGKLRIELILPSSWLRWLRDGAEFDFEVDETKSTLPGRVVRIGAAVEGVSQTIKVIGEFGTAAPGILTGMSGTARFSRTDGEE
jgi:membrane fusion protein, multidrug efflux system